MQHMLIRCEQSVDEMKLNISTHCTEFERLLEEEQMRDLEWELGYLTALAENGYGSVVIGGVPLADKVEAYKGDEERFINNY